MSTLREFKEVMDLIVSGMLKPVIDRTYPLQEAASAQERLWRNESFGKITLDIPH
jgi:NADPH:quinone reductase-like Zn-dependent oxidoreductase